MTNRSVLHIANRARKLACLLSRPLQPSNRRLDARTLCLWTPVPSASTAPSALRYRAFHNSTSCRAEGREPPSSLSKDSGQHSTPSPQQTSSSIKAESTREGSTPHGTEDGGYTDSKESGQGGGGGGADTGAENDNRGGGRGPLTWGAVTLLGVAGTLVVGYYRMKWDEKQNRVSSEVTSTGEPALGGPFTLVDMHGRPVTDKDFHGSFILLYFGFCFCPDICPSELVKIGSIAEKLEKKLGEGVVKPVFVSVDPDRDSLAQLKHYAQDFHPSIEYLTGTKDQVAKAAKAYRVYFSKTEEHDEGEDYLVDHSIVIYLLAPNGEFLDFYTQRTTIADCVDRTVKQAKSFKPQAA